MGGGGETSCEAPASLSYIPYKGPSPHQDMDNIIISCAGVEKLLRALKRKKATGPDALLTRIIKENAQILAPVFTCFFQQSLDRGEAPSDWLRANVSALFKKGDHCDPANYRLVSLTSVTYAKFLSTLVFAALWIMWMRIKF